MKRTVLLVLLAASMSSPALASPVHIHDDMGRDVVLPALPQRIASTYDVDITIPLIELGATPIASHGRLRKNGSHYLMSSKLLTGVDFDNSSIAFIGASGIDLEALAALKPDLIVTEISRPTPVEMLEKIAPTVVVNSDLGAPHIYALLAAATGHEQDRQRLEKRYQSQIAKLKEALHPENVTVSVFQPIRGKLNVYHSYRAIGQVLRDAGFRFLPIMDEIPEGQSVIVSAERLPELDADVIFDPYRSEGKGGKEAELATMEAIVPGFCRFLTACTKGRYALVPREAAISNSYAALAKMVVAVRNAFEPSANIP